MKLPIGDELDSPSIYVHVHNAGSFRWNFQLWTTLILNLSTYVHVYNAGILHMELPIEDKFDSPSHHICTCL